MERREKPGIERTPVREFKRGHVVARIWFNPTTGKLGRYTMTMSRLVYRDENVQATGSFDYNDLGNVRKVAGLARLYMWWKGAETSFRPRPKRRWRRR